MSHCVLQQQSHLFLSFIITVMCIAYGLNCMAILNPARDLGPRLFTLIAGWGVASFQPIGGNYWWVAGVLGPHVGAVIGGWLYFLSIDHSNLKLGPGDVHSGHKTELRPVETDGSEKGDEVMKEEA